VTVTIIQHHFYITTIMNMKKVIIAMGLAFGVSIVASAADKPVHEGPSVSVPASEIKFVDTGVKSDGKELKAGPAYGNLANGRHGTFVRAPAGFKSAPHTHTEDYYAVVLKGVGANYQADGKAVPLPAGSYWFQRGEESHVTECLSDTDCLFFLVQPGKFDYVLSK
jgi:quercetin dioxygenase-like cupin family protein